MQQHQRVGRQRGAKRLERLKLSELFVARVRETSAQTVRGARERRLSMRTVRREERHIGRARELHPDEHQHQPANERRALRPRERERHRHDTGHERDERHEVTLLVGEQVPEEQRRVQREHHEDDGGTW